MKTRSYINNDILIPQDAWNALSMQEKAAMIRAAVKNGITKLPEIREKYNEFAEGGNLYKKGGPKKSNNNAAIAMQYFMNKGLSQHAAAGLAGNLMRESQFVPTATNPSSKAYGLAQWLGERKRKLFEKYGNNPTLNQQLDFVWWELNNTHKRGLQALMNSKTPEEAAKNAMGYYEFSAGPEAAIADMKKWKQDGVGAMNLGIANARHLMGLPNTPATFPDEQYAPQEYTPTFTPSNPTAFFGNTPDTTPIVIEAPRVIDDTAYNPEILKQQEQQKNLRNFNMVLSMLGEPADSQADFMNTANMLTISPYSMFSHGGSIHINPSKKGTFTAAATKHGMGVQEFASKVLANKDNYSTTMVRKANFAKNASKWHGLGGSLYPDGGYLSRLANRVSERKAEVQTKIDDYNKRHAQPRINTTSGAGYVPSINSITREKLDRGIRLKDSNINSMLKGALSVARILDLDKRIKGEEGDVRYRRNLFNLIDPTSAVPESPSEALAYLKLAEDARGSHDFKYRRKYIDATADAGWAKRLGLPYDKNLLIDNGDGSVKLSKLVENEIPVDTNFIKNRIKENEAALKNSYGAARKVRETALMYDKEALDSLRKTYTTGEPVVMDEHSHVSRHWTSNGEDGYGITPLSILHKYGLRYNRDKNQMEYSDIYDFNGLEDFVPGNPFNIRGVINLNK